MAATAGYRSLSAQKVISSVAPAVPEKPRALVLSIGELSLDGGTQMRAGLNAGTVAEYAEAMLQAGGWGQFPSVEVVYDGNSYWVWDGFHRCAAFREALRQNPARMSPSISVIVQPGTRRDAVLLAAGANAAHGLRRTVEDKRRAVDALLNDPEWGAWSDGAIARAALVSAPFVASRRELRDQSAAVSATLGGETPARRYVDKHGAERVMDVRNIAAGNTARAASRAAAVVQSSAPASRQNGAALAKCSVCGRPLSDPAHAAAGMGPVCACKRAGAGGDGGDLEDDLQEIARVEVPRVAALSAMKTRWLAMLADLPLYEQETGDKAGSRAIRSLVSAALQRLDVAAGVGGAR